MKRYKLLKDLPSVKAGYIIKESEDGFFCGYKMQCYPDFFEEVKEKESLEDKFKKDKCLGGKADFYSTPDTNDFHFSEKDFVIEYSYKLPVYKKLAAIAKQHYLSIFDEAVTEIVNTELAQNPVFSIIRKRLEEG